MKYLQIDVTDPLTQAEYDSLVAQSANDATLAEVIAEHDSLFEKNRKLCEASEILRTLGYDAVVVQLGFEHERLARRIVIIRCALHESIQHQEK
jgi:hypothetical protein